VTTFVCGGDLEHYINSTLNTVFRRAEENLREISNDGKPELVEVTRDKLIMIASDVIDLVMEKNADYADAWQKNGIQGTLCRLADKLLRVETLADGREALVIEEKLPQTILDGIGYSFLALLWLKEHGEFPEPNSIRQRWITKAQERWEDFYVMRKRHWDDEPA